MFSIRLLPTVIVTILLSMFMYIVNFGFWADRNIVQTDGFVVATVDALKVESSRIALSTIAVERIIEEVPAFRVVEPLLVDTLAELLDSPALESVLLTVGSRLHTILLNADGGGIVVDLTPIEELVMGPLAAIAPDLASQVPDDFFREVVLVEPGSAPDVQQYVSSASKIVLVAAAAVLLLLIALFTLAKPWSKSVAYLGGSMALAGLITAFIVPGGRSLTIGNARDPNVEVVITNLYDELVSGLKVQSRWLLAVGVVLLGVGIGITMRNRRMTVPA